ncbi:pseudouridine synthase [Chitinasiproducens palmae]|nr:pseudouridine synthase [Chitinasiproducens palmae]
MPSASSERPVQTVATESADGPRLSKRMAELGLCSRREADEWIEKGWVTVDGAIAVLGQRVLPSQKIDIDRRARSAQASLATFLLNKPIGYVSGQPEDDHPPAVALLKPDAEWLADGAVPSRFDRAMLQGLAPAGRLDIDSTGLLVLTQDGRVARQLIGEQSEVDKEYLVRVHYGAVEQDVAAHFPEERLARLRHGLSLDGVALKPAQVDWQNGEQLRFVLTEGRKRQIRRMCELVGLEVVGLRRIRIGGVVLGNLPVGQWRLLGADERF